MKTTLFYCSIIILIAIGCSKRVNNNAFFTGNWKLTKSVEIWFTNEQFTIYPAKDSAVFLLLNANSTYQSKLNNIAVSQGNYAVSASSYSSYQQNLKLQNLQPTGIFQPLVSLQFYRANNINRYCQFFNEYQPRYNASYSGNNNTICTTSLLFCKTVKKYLKPIAAIVSNAFHFPLSAFNWYNFCFTKHFSLISLQ